MDLGGVFDAYGRQARLQPALLTLFPLFVTVAVWFPALYETGAGLLGLAVACGVTVLFAHVARMRGRSAERRLFSEWGGKPTTIWLRHRDTNLDAHTTRRYHNFLSGHVLDWHAPTEEDERSDSDAADARYESAVRWLLEFTRDRKRFPLVFKENVSYGFRRNLYGLKPIGLAVAVFCIAVNAGLLYWEYVEKAGEISPVGIVVAVVSALALVAWLVVVTPGWVRDAADAYTKTLLSSCDG